VKVLQPGKRVRLLTVLVLIALTSSTLIILVSVASCQPTPSPPLPIETSTAALATPTYTLAPTRTPTPEVTPTHTPLPPTPTYTLAPTSTPTLEATPTDTPLPPTPTPTRTATPSPTSTTTMTPTPTPTETPTPSPTPTATMTPTPTPTETPIPSPTPTTTMTPTPVFHCIYIGTTLCSGYDMGVDDSAGRRDWVTDMDGYMRMAYPGGLDWGAVFITVGPPRDPPRPGQDFSAYRFLSVELRGERGGESVNIGIKDNDDPDDGREKKLLASGLTTSWQTFTFALSDFRTADRADPTRLYVVIEFVFEPGWPGQTVYFRNVKYLP
jgi:hypothetical protein